jgi:hypothetical protein
MEFVALEIEGCHLLLGDLDALGYVLVSSSQRMVRPVVVVVLAMSSTTARRLVRGMARQFCVMWQNMRCSILFHFEVPGG